MALAVLGFGADLVRILVSTATKMLFDFGPFSTIGIGVISPPTEGPIDFGKCCLDNSDLLFDRLFIRLAGNMDSYKILDKFHIGADQTIHMRVAYSSVSHRHTLEKMLSG